MKRLLAGTVKILIVLLLLYIFAYPHPIEPESFQPNLKPSKIFESARDLSPVTDDYMTTRPFPQRSLDWPGFVAVRPDGNLYYTGLSDGRIITINPLMESVSEFASTKGRPMGMVYSTVGTWQNHLIVADAIRGLLAVSPAGIIYTLTVSADNLPYGLPFDVAIDRNGSVYFTDASYRFGIDEYLYDILEARPNGRLLKHDPAKGTTTALLDNLHFATGVALSPDESYIYPDKRNRPLPGYSLLAVRPQEGELRGFY